MKTHIQTAIHDRNKALEGGRKEFDFHYVERFFSKFNQILMEAGEEHEKTPDEAYRKEEAALIPRLLEYRNNYFAWVACFELPVTNNLSERSLRDAKTHMKVSGQFWNMERDDKSYVETASTR